MSKPNESSLRASYFHLPVGRVLAGVGAALVLAGPSTALAQSRQCPVQFTVSNATELGALQFTADYAAAASVGDFAVAGCTFTAPGVTDSNVNGATNKMQVGWASTTAFNGPGLFVTCNFVMPSDASNDPTAGNFVVTVDDASNADVPPAPAAPAPTIVVAVGTCTNVASDCQNGVLENGEKCDDGNAVGADGCDAACGLSDCPSTPSASCRISTVAGKSKLSFGDSTTDTKDKAGYSWKSGSATDVADWKNPLVAGKTYSWCVYDGGVLVKGATVAGGAATWKASGSTGFQFKGDAQGMSQLKLKGGEDGKASIGVKAAGKSGNFTSPNLPLVGPTLSQVVIDDGVAPLCFETTAGTPSTNTDASYSALGNP